MSQTSVAPRDSYSLVLETAMEQACLRDLFHALKGRSIDLQLAKAANVALCTKTVQWFTRTIIEGRYYLTAAAVVLILDIILTFDVEVERVWKARFTYASLLFYINRYLPPVMYAVVLFGLNYSKVTKEFCAGVFQVIPPIAIVFSEAIIGALLILRTHALYKESKCQLSHTVLGILIVVYFIQLALSVFAAKNLEGIGPIEQAYNPGCILFFPRNNTLRLLCLWLTNIVFNVIVFMCTFKRTARAHWQDQGAGMRYTMHTVILADATLYFVAVLSAKTMNLMMLVFYPQWNSINWASNHVIDVILTSHFFLHLREEGDKVMRPACSLSESGVRSIIIIHVGGERGNPGCGPINCRRELRYIYDPPSRIPSNDACRSCETDEQDGHVMTSGMSIIRSPLTLQQQSMREVVVSPMERSTCTCTRCTRSSPEEVWDESGSTRSYLVTEMQVGDHYTARRHSVS